MCGGCKIEYRFDSWLHLLYGVRRHVRQYLPPAFIRLQPSNFPPSTHKPSSGLPFHHKFIE